MDNYKILIFSELTQDNYPQAVSFELVSKIYSLVKNFQNFEIQVLLVGKRINYDKIINDFSKCGADKVIIVNDEVLADYSTARYKKAVVEILNKEKPHIVLFGATVFARELAPMVATALETGLTADCTDLNITQDCVLEATRPTYGGKMNAVILCKTLPQMATVRPNVFKIQETGISKNTKAVFDWVDTSVDKQIPKILEIIRFDNNSQNDLSKTNIIFSGGKGLQNKENFKKLNELAKLTGGTVGASRGAVDSGFAPQELQIGQTGNTVSAKIYVAFGISGMAQHLSGINSCDKIIAVNKDETAPIFKVADVGIVGDAVEIIDKMIEKLK